MTSQHYTEALNYPVIDPDGNELWPGGKIIDKMVVGIGDGVKLNMNGA